MATNPAETVVPPATDTPAGATEAGGGAADSDEGEKKVTITSHEYVTLKASREQAKKDAEELAALKEQAKSRTTITDTADDDAPMMSVAERKAYKAELRASYKAGNRDAGALLAGIEVAEESAAAHRTTMFQMEMEKIPEAKRDAVRKYMAETGAPTPTIAYRLLRGGDAETLAQENERLTKELAEARKAKSRPEGTRIVGGAAGADDDDGVPLITLAEYNKRMRENPHKTIADRKPGPKGEPPKFRIGT